jgi:chemotaxis protein methyltransferase CheR
MSTARLLPLRFRHVVFPREVRRRKDVVNLADQAPVPPPPPEREVSLSQETAAFVNWLFRESQLDAGAYRTETLQRRLPACLRALRARSLSHARELLEAQPELAATAINAMIIGVTAFFRDPAVFDQLRLHVLPELMRGRGSLSVWSVGCSDGAELYSAAILLAESNLLAGSYLLGIDCRPEAIRRARLGRYDPLAVKNVPADWLGRYFLPGADAWEIVPALRPAVRWRTADVLNTHEPGAWDAILFRNTAMYFRPEAAGPLWERLEASLRPGGVLVLGKSERPVGVKRLSALGSCIYRRTRG